MNCCDEYGDCRQSDDCPIRTGVVLPHQAAHARRVARIKSSTPKFADVVPPETGNFKIIDLGPDDDGVPLNHAENMKLLRLMIYLLLAFVAIILAISYGTERWADLIWSLLQEVS